jgi:hypothetical protein
MEISEVDPLYSIVLTKFGPHMHMQFSNKNVIDVPKVVIVRLAV